MAARDLAARRLGRRRSLLRPERLPHCRATFPRAPAVRLVQCPALLASAWIAHLPGVLSPGAGDLARLPLLPCTAHVGGRAPGRGSVRAELLRRYVEPHLVARCRGAFLPGAADPAVGHASQC